MTTPLPAAPARTDAPDVFVNKADAFLTVLPQFQIEMTQAQTDVNTNTPLAIAAANNATAAANAAQAAVGVSAWVSGKTYTVNQVAISPSNAQSYRRIVAGAGTAEPATDLTNWVLLFGNDANGAFLPISFSGSNIDLSKGNYFVTSVAANTTFAINNCPSPGFSFTLEVVHTGGSVGFPASCKLIGNISPTLVTGKTHMFMFVTSNNGTRWRVTALPNFDT